jgi:hypothetical protein
MLSLVTYFRPRSLTIPWVHFQALHREHAPDVAELWSGTADSIYAVELLVASPRKYIKIVPHEKDGPDFSPRCFNLERVDEEHHPMPPSDSYHFVSQKIVLRSTSVMSILDETAHMLLEVQLPPGGATQLNIPALLTKELPGASYTYKILLI